MSGSYMNRHSPNPIVVEVTRGQDVESRHRGAIAVFDSEGNSHYTLGDISLNIFPRSAVKPIQALPLIETGAAEKFNLSNAEIAIACGSHKGEDAQLDVVNGWLDRIGLSEADLSCGAHPPRNKAAADALIKANKIPTAIHNNCSGKHAGFLTTALHMKEPLHGYIRRDHPVQKRVCDVIGEMGDFEVSVSPWGLDGCNIPTIGMPISALARAMAQMAKPHRLSPRRKSAVRRILRAMADRPDMVAGTGYFDTEVTKAAGGTFMVKAGAEGVYAAALPERRLGIALKVDDGGKRAAECVMASLLMHFVDPDQTLRSVLKSYQFQTIQNCSNQNVGVVRAVFDCKS